MASAPVSASEVSPGHVIAELLDELAHAVLDLRAVACRSEPQLFDATDRHDPAGRGRENDLPDLSP